MSRQKSPMSYVFDIVENRMGCVISSRVKKMLKNYLENVKPPLYSINVEMLLSEGNYDKVADICIDKIELDYNI